MHLQVNQRLQEVASYKRDKYYPQEIDVALNKAVDRLLKQGVDNKFADTQINLSHVSGLIKKNKSLDIYKPSATDPLYEEQLNNVYSVIPPDLYWTVNSRVEIIRDPYNCDTAPALATTSLPEWKAIVPFPAANGSAPYFPAVTVTSTVLGTLYTAPTAISAGFQSPNSQYVLINDILEELYPHATLKVYWERYRDVYSPNSFIFVSSSNAGTIRIQGTGLTTSSVAMTQTTYTTYNRALISALPSKQVKLATVKIQEEDSLYSALTNSFYNTRQDSVVMDQTFDYFIFYRDESFIITRAYVDYIRKPRTISLLLKQDCDLAPSVHHKIVDLAVELLRLDTKDQAYPQTVQDTQIRTF